MDTAPVKSLFEEENLKWINDKRNATYWNARGKVFRAFPVSDTEVILVDCVSAGEIKMSNAEIAMEVKAGNLLEIDFTKVSVAHRLISGNTGARKTTPEEQASVLGKYARPATVEGKYKSVGVMKRLIEEGKKFPPASSVRPGETSAARAGGDTAHAASASPGQTDDLPEASSEPVPAASSALANKYKKKDS